MQEYTHRLRQATVKSSNTQVQTSHEHKHTHNFCNLNTEVIHKDISFLNSSLTSRTQTHTHTRAWEAA